MDKLVVSGTEFAPVLTEVLSSDGHISLVVSGFSMTPFLKHGRDTVHLRTCTKKDLRRGQILLFKRCDGSLILHRIRKVLPDGQLVMNGDSQTWCETISYSQVLAVAFDIERNGQHIPCDSIRFGLWNLFWYPTRPVRSAIFKAGRVLLRKGMRQ